MIIATRKLKLTTEDGEKEFSIEIYAPNLSDGIWMCRYHINWPQRPRASYAAGIDSIQALHLALQKIGMELYISPYHLAGALKWESAGDGYGFPVPKNGRDLLIGSDKLFDG